MNNVQLAIAAVIRHLLSISAEEFTANAEADAAALAQLDESDPAYPIIAVGARASRLIADLRDELEGIVPPTIVLPPDPPAGSGPWPESFPVGH